ncbi:hypothetical protein FHT40_005667 [Mycolicibacterium sp. BK556]|uniref:hypothetical protein n=1 Tax=unclassified Mycolicibacterium TaxID=2636767 RepID=UPI00160B6041|nr:MULTISPECIES: hypothetical protein [unclassified Mycolicibacterium]MBB3605978.1 hypothetical protein [Mycolicibacterium sp. BK556]MBB3632555.1 hypothetical protein [Mycolicibacterium sp. BK607]
MSEVWKFVDMFLPSDLSEAQVRTALRDGIIRTAIDSGEFVSQYRVCTGVNHSEGWRKWTASYLPGPPGVLRF